MKNLSAVVLFLLVGCSVGPTMEELESQALLTGDWSRVEKRERTLVRRQLRAGIQCPNGYIGYCVDQIVAKRCTCLERDALRFVLSGRRF